MITNSIKRTNKRSGFMAMTTALVVAIFLFLISAAVMNYANQSLRTEAWMADRAQRSLYPIAWSTANFVLNELSHDLSTDRRLQSGVFHVFASSDNPQPGGTGPTGGSLRAGIISFDVLIGDASIDVRIVISGDSGNNAVVNDTSQITVKVLASSGGATSEAMGQIVSDDTAPHPKRIRIVWR